jgi:hypothetical protein
MKWGFEDLGCEDGSTLGLRSSDTFDIPLVARLQWVGDADESEESGLQPHYYRPTVGLNDLFRRRRRRASSGCLLTIVAISVAALLAGIALH